MIQYFSVLNCVWLINTLFLIFTTSELFNDFDLLICCSSFQIWSDMKQRRVVSTSALNIKIHECIVVDQSMAIIEQENQQQQQKSHPPLFYKKPQQTVCYFAVWKYKAAY